MEVRKNIPVHTHPVWTESAWFAAGANDPVRCFFHQVSSCIGMHQNEFYELNIIVSGYGTHIMDGREISVKPGNMCVIPPNVTHGYLGEEGLNVFHVLIQNKFLDRYVQELQELPGFMLLFEISPYISQRSTQVLTFQLGDHNMKKIMHDIDGMIEMERSAYPGRHVHKTARLMCLLSELSSYVYDSNRNIISTPDTNTQIILKTMEFIRANSDAEISIDEIARDAGMSRSYYSKLFRQLTGCTPHAFILRCRIANARKLLCYTELSMADIAQQCGFYDSSHFIRVFSKQESITPSAYRLLHSRKASFSMCTLLAPPCNLQEGNI